ncbi:aminopeptidase [Flavobacterium amniphilum]|uniref:M1 family aminopeptidase n=1 Tax=Flavobacterium amniphilum TaxID=1834035 RepID=UPI00202A2DA0|nr:M1 family aminopeptidase [Flavobacterium amniphilum]MCL9807101.1 aminopeptidase [Flavobacterium amniphilum]
MFRKLVQFEWHYHTKSVLFYVTFAVFFLLGLLLSKAGFGFANAYRNSPYLISYIVGFMSMMLIFSMTIFVAQTQLRDKETKFDAIIYATPIAKWHYLMTQFVFVFLAGSVSFLLFIVGLMVGVQFVSPSEELGPFSILNYVVPALVFAIPNTFLIASLLTGLAWISRSKLIIYVGGLFIYILYVIGSIFSNSPIFAGASPATPEAMSLTAKLDPFGLAAFFEQTRYWTAFQKNNHFVSLTGNLLFNRVLWFCIALAVIFISYQIFSFRKMNEKRKKTPKIAKNDLKVTKKQVFPETEFQTLKHNFNVIRSFVKIDLSLILKGIPFVLIVIMLTGLLTIEISDEIDGGRRMAESITTTGLMISTLMDRLPVILILILLFYSNELIWRSESDRFAALENVTPHHSGMVFISKLVTLTIVPILLIFLGICIAIAFQLANNNAPIEFGLYLSLFYFLGLPMLLISILIMTIQTLIQNRYMGLVLASVVAIVLSTSIGQMIGVTYPLFRFADVLKIEHFDMNGFGQYKFSFLVKMLYCTGFSLILLFLGSIVWKRNASLIQTFRTKQLNLFQKAMLVLGSLLFMGFGSYTFYEVNVKKEYLTTDEQFNWQQQYEEKYRKFQKINQPTITSVKTAVDLFPEENRYNVKGSYELVNNSKEPIDSLLLYISDQINMESVSIPDAKILSKDERFGHSWYKLNTPLMPGKSFKMSFSFTSSWSAFTGHTPFNSIIDNGSFMRISNYFPGFGYQTDNEITNSKERKKRNMPDETLIRKLEDTETQPYDFIDFDAVVSTSEDQIAVGIGDLMSQWKSEGRNYFHYKSDGKIPFRFAFSSARYEVKKELYKGISIEVYYDKRHGRNINELISATEKTLDYCVENFGRYPYKTIRYAEVSAFAEGFAATAYPSTLYMKENFGFYSDITRGDKEDIINQLAGHELSHQWWGNAQFNPEEKEGGYILTEMLAMYTEIMLYEKRHGWDRALETLQIHQDLYLSSRSFATEMPLYKTHYDTPHLPYNKGTVVMHQLRMLIGEKNVNKALRSLMVNYAFPEKAADTRDFLKEIYKVSPETIHPKIDELFRQIVTYSAKINSVSSKRVSDKKYEVTFELATSKFREDGKGKQTLIKNDASIDVALYDANEKKFIQTFPIVNNKVKGKMTLYSKPESIEIDPNLMIMDTFLEDNVKKID